MSSLAFLGVKRKVVKWLAHKYGESIFELEKENSLRWVLSTPGHSYCIALDHSLPHLLDDSSIPLLPPKTSNPFFLTPKPQLINSCLTEIIETIHRVFAVDPNTSSWHILTGLLVICLSPIRMGSTRAGALVGSLMFSSLAYINFPWVLSEKN